MAALGLLLLAATVVIALGGILANTGSGHPLGHTVNILGYHLHGSTGKLLLIGVIVGALGMLGLNMLLAGVGIGFKRRARNRKERKMAHSEARVAVADRDRLAQQLEREHAARPRAEEREVTAAGTDTAAPSDVDLSEPNPASPAGRGGLLHRHARR
jgi:hypothetical protein